MALTWLEPVREIKKSISKSLKKKIKTTQIRKNTTRKNTTRISKISKTDAKI